MIHHRGEDLWVWSRVVGDGRLEAHGLDLRSGELMRICASRLTVEESGFPVAPILAEGVLNHLRVARARREGVLP